MTDTQMARYAQFLESQGVSGVQPLENESLRIGEYRFYLIERAPGAPDLMAAVGKDGALIRWKEPAGWHGLLTAGPAEEVASRVAFLDRIANIADPAHNYGDPRVGRMLEKPKLETAADGAVTFTVWVLMPPLMNDPFQLVIRTTAAGEATFTETFWEELAN